MKGSLAILALGLELLGALVPAAFAQETRLHRAAQAGDLCQVRRLLASGEDRFARDAMGQTPLIRAAIGRATAVVHELLRGPIDVGARDVTGATALHHAAAANDVSTLELLLAAGADPRARNRRCQSVLEWAAAAKAHKAFRVLSGTLAQAKPLTDGTLEECGIDPSEPVPSLKDAWIAYHRRGLVIKGLEDYPHVSRALAELPADDSWARALIPDVIAVVDHPTFPATQDDSARMKLDFHIRLLAADVLTKIVKTRKERRVVRKAFLTMMKEGDCHGFRKRQCTGYRGLRCDALSTFAIASDLWRSWLGKSSALKSAPSATEQLCQECDACEGGRFENRLAAAVHWFRHDPHGKQRALTALAAAKKAGNVGPDMARFLGESLEAKTLPSALSH